MKKEIIVGTLAAVALIIAAIIGYFGLIQQASIPINATKTAEIKATKLSESATYLFETQTTNIISTPSKPLQPTITYTPTMTRTNTLTSTSTISYTPLGFCPSSPEPCLYMPSSIDTWKDVSKNTSYSDECRWPEIANINRNLSGNYRILDFLLTTAGVFIPPSNRISEYKPAIRKQTGLISIIHQCPANPSLSDLPCTYMINEKDGVTGSYYLPLAKKIYNAYEYKGTNLDEYIQNANLSEGCHYKPIQLLPGVSIVIPKLPSDQYE